MLNFDIFLKKYLTKDAFALFLISAFVFLHRLSFSGIYALDLDEAHIFYVVRNILDGGIIYKTVFTHKGPLVYFLLFPVVKFSGGSIFAIRIFTTLYLIATIIFVYMFGRKFIDGPLRLLPPLIYAMLFVYEPNQGLSSNGEIFMMLPIVLAFLFFKSYLDNAKSANGAAFFCGVLSAVAFFMKATAAFTFMVFPVVFIYKYYFLEKSDLKLIVKDVVIYLSGCLIVLLVILLYMLANDALLDFYNDFIIFNRKYAGSISALEGLKKLILFIDARITWQFDFLTALAFISILYVFSRLKDLKPQNEKVLFVTALFVFSLISVYSPKNMYPHYYLHMGLSYAVMIPFAASIVGISRDNLIRIVGIILIIVLYKTISPPLIYGKEIIRGVRGEGNAKYEEISNFIVNHTEPNDTIFVLGHPILLYLSKRHTPTKHFSWVYHLPRWEQQLQIKRFTLNEFKKNKPKLFVYWDHFWNLGHDGRTNFDGHYLKDFMQDNYKIIKKIEDYQIYGLKNNNE